MPIKSIEWNKGSVRLLDQTQLPHRQAYLDISDHRTLIEAIQSLRIRGAPALGVAAAYGIVLGAQGIGEVGRERFLKQLREIADEIVAARPTAVNMAWAAKRVMTAAMKERTTRGIRTAVEREALGIQAEDERGNRLMGKNGARLIAKGSTVLTHCNTGSLATAGYGTALGVIRSAHEQGKIAGVYATETRPLLQGARLTAWELLQDGCDATLITDSMAGHFLSSGAIDCVLVGADRITMNGDVANKIGTYTLAVVAKENKVPFYVAAPTSTIDATLASGKQIPIEQRKPQEVTSFGGMQTAPKGVRAANPAFDVTPNRYVTAIITEKGVAKQPYRSSLKRMMAA